MSALWLINLHKAVLSKSSETQTEYTGLDISRKLKQNLPLQVVPFAKVSGLGSLTRI